MTGRPPKYETPEELQGAIDKYLVENEGKLTITGLVLFLGFCSRQSFYDYEMREEFSYTIKRARLHIENYYESKLTGNNYSGAIFALKNFGWLDTQEYTHSIKNELPVNITIARDSK